MFGRKKKPEPPTPREPRQENLFRGFEFLASLKDLEAPVVGTFEPRVYPLNECNHVKSERWWWGDE